MKKPTEFAHAHRPEILRETSVNPAITRASTLLFAKADDLYNGKHRIYGRHGSDLHDKLQMAFCQLENGAGCTLTPSGLAANTLSILSSVKAGDHILVTDSTYGPVRHFCTSYLAKMGVETSYFKPDAGAELQELVQNNTSLIVLESPGSLTLEIQDLPAICAFAQTRKITTVVDNTWSAGLVYNPLELGADIVVHSATKYMGGHSDVLFGAVIAKDGETAKRVHDTAHALGNSTSPDDAYQVLRGFRTLTTRFDKQAKNALALATWIAGRREVKSVIHPALPTHPQHARWKRDFSGAGCLFSIVLHPCLDTEVLALLDRLNVFAKGFSFGGYESLVIHCDPQLVRNFDPEFGGPLIRIACGLEDIEDMKADWTCALDRLAPTA